MATASIVASAWAAGAGAGISLFTITPLLSSSASVGIMLQVWQLAFNRGKSYMPPAAAAITASYLYVSWTHAARGLEWRGFAVAAALTLGIVPFTFLFIRDTIVELEGMGRKEGHGVAEAVVRATLSRWGALNLARSCLPLLGTAAAIWNLLK
ncbi:hypothetical protein JX266_008476 [Neoarthrinium moseri]|nr:hypothetical protein JX266_008476 [Neoarthrinium moseri]